MEKGCVLVLCLARTKHFMLSMKHIFCVFTSGSDLDILDLIRVLHQSGGNVQVRFSTKCTAKFNGANYILIGDFQAMEGISSFSRVFGTLCLYLSETD